MDAQPRCLILLPRGRPCRGGGGGGGGAGGTVCPFGIHHQNSRQCLQVEVSIEISIACCWANFSDDLEEVKHDKEEAS